MYVYCLYRRFMREKRNCTTDLTSVIRVSDCQSGNALLPETFEAGICLLLCRCVHTFMFRLILSICCITLAFFLFKWLYDWQECSRCIFRVCFVIVLQEVVIPTEMQSRWMLSFTNVSSIFFSRQSLIIAVQMMLKIPVVLKIGHQG